MGYSSSILAFEQFPFTAIPGTTADEIRRRMNLEGPELGDYLEYFFTLDVDENFRFTMESSGESLKAYDLEDSLTALIRVMGKLQESDPQLPGLRFNFQLWGEEPGDALLYRSDGERLYRIGKIAFIGEPQAV